MAYNEPGMGLKIWNLVTDLFDHNALANNFIAIGQHNHTAGQGAQVPTGGIQDGAITASKIAAGAITGTLFQDGSIPGSKIVPNSITGAQIATGTITAANLASSLLSSFNAGVVQVPGATSAHVANWGTFTISGPNPADAHYSAYFAITHGLGVIPTAMFVQCFQADVVAAPVYGSAGTTSSTFQQQMGVSAADPTTTSFYGIAHYLGPDAPTGPAWPAGVSLKAAWLALA